MFDCTVQIPMCKITQREAVAKLSSSHFLPPLPRKHSVLTVLASGQPVSYQV